jgi:hypothetical protein
MNQDHTSLHNSFCANRSVGTALIFVAFFAILVFAGWREASGKPHPPDTGAFSLFFDVIVLLVIGLLFAEFKCLRERVVIALNMLTPVAALSFDALPSLARFRPIVDRIDFAFSAAALVISISMLISAFRSRRRILSFGKTRRLYSRRRGLDE